MELLQLEYFYAVAVNQHVTRTAEQLHIAQPSLTQSIRRLEKELGVPLFRHSGRNITLTEYGVYLRDAVSPILESLHQIPEEIQELAHVRKKTVRLNVLAASTLVTHALISYKKEHDGLNFRLIQNSMCEDADITIFTRSFFQQPTDTKERYQIFTERIFLAVPQNFPYANCDSVMLRDFANQDFISLSGSRSIRSICDRYCMHAGFIPNIIYESDSPDTVKNLIAGGLGVGFWPHYTWGQGEMDQIRLLPIAEPVCQRDLVIQLHDSAVNQEEAVNFFEFLSRYLQNLKNNKLNIAGAV
ncbi:MAG: LysR family transcriptional regulator [Oscillospiraceae bacterium]|nr:LysR family transcriptional regulator [Oscillospiraceae bacterium]